MVRIIEYEYTNKSDDDDVVTLFVVENVSIQVLELLGKISMMFNEYVFSVGRTPDEYEISSIMTDVGDWDDYKYYSESGLYDVEAKYTSGREDVLHCEVGRVQVIGERAFVNFRDE